MNHSRKLVQQRSLCQYEEITRGNIISKRSLFSEESKDVVQKLSFIVMHNWLSDWKTNINEQSNSYLDSLDSEIEKHPLHLHSTFLTWTLEDGHGSVTWELVSSSTDLVGTEDRSAITRVYWSFDIPLSIVNQCKYSLQPAIKVNFNINLALK